MLEREYSPPEFPLDVLHRDGHLLVVNKPSGLLSVPGKGANMADSLLSRVQVAFPETLLVHRLDLDTSGVMVFALSRQAQRHLGLQFEHRRVRKVYIARVHGLVEPAEGEIERPLRVDWPNRPKQMIDYENGRFAKTEWKVQKYEDNATRVKLLPLTGRSHQLRVHMLSIGHPILGDSLYADGEALAGSDRLQLHAESIRFRHPDGGRGVNFRAACPF